MVFEIMFSIRRRWSMFLTILFIIVFDLTLIDSSVSNQEDCNNFAGEGICYFKGGQTEVDWLGAWQLCNFRNATLPVIRNREQQNALTNYLKSHIRNSSAWTSGRNFTYDKWTWINGEPLTNYGSIAPLHETGTHVVLDSTFASSANYANRSFYHLCQYSGPLCNIDTYAKLMNGCIQASGAVSSWHEARNQCLRKGGDLATLNDNDLKLLRNSSKLADRKYWIGLRKSSWRWNWKKAGISIYSDEIEYSNWSNNTDFLRGDCISIDASSGLWTAIRCTETSQCICQRKFTFVVKSTSDQGTCEGNNKRNISYFKGLKEDTEGLDWNAAWHLCNIQNSSLPVICNQNEQHDLTTYLETQMRSSAIWTSGKNITFNKWTWINGKPFENRGIIPVKHADYTHVNLNPDQSYKAEHPQTKVYYLCQFPGSLCNHSRDIHVRNDRCLRPSDEDRPWYNARNQCLLSGGDLATLDDADLNIIRNSNKLNRTHSYWIGLRKNSWSWGKTADSNDEIKYSSWSNDSYSLSGECISIDASNGEWKAVRCTDKKKVVCQRILGSNMMRSTTSNKTPNMTSSKTSQNTTPRPSNPESHVLLYSGVSAGIVIIIICIIVIIIAVLSTRKPAKNTNQSKTNNNTEQNRLEESPDKRANAPANPSHNPPGNGAGDIQGVYAEIPLATINQQEVEATNQQPGIVYASVEFQKEPTYMEANKKRDSATSPTKVGPLGGIYAMPESKGNSSGGSNSHPIQITAQGDVYALPMKNSKSPTANPPGANIYANLS